MEWCPISLNDKQTDIKKIGMVIINLKIYSSASISAEFCFCIKIKIFFNIKLYSALAIRALDISYGNKSLSCGYQKYDKCGRVLTVLKVISLCL